MEDLKKGSNSPFIDIDASIKPSKARLDSVMPDGGMPTPKQLKVRVKNNSFTDMLVQPALDKSLQLTKTSSTSVGAEMLGYPKDEPIHVYDGHLEAFHTKRPLFSS